MAYDRYTDMANTFWRSSEMFSKAVADNPAVAAPLAAVGGLWLASKLYGVAAFTYFHFLLPSQLNRYKGSSTDAWALITGASDGIGKGFAHELCSRGFNVVLHGRNEKKLDQVKEELAKQWPNRKIRVVVFDAGAVFDIAKLEAAFRPIQDLKLKLLVNNVGGHTKPMWLPLNSMTAECVRQWTDLNIRFHVELTRVLLPQLTQNSPAAVVNNGSFAAELPLPYMTVYGGCKAFLKRWSTCMDTEMKATGHDVQFYNIQTGEVSSNSYRKVPGGLVLAPQNYAAAVLNKIGGNRRDTPGHWVHALQLAIMNVFPGWMLEQPMSDMMRVNMELEKKGEL